jgi:hypothetical protein
LSNLRGQFRHHLRHRGRYLWRHGRHGLPHRGGDGHRLIRHHLCDGRRNIGRCLRDRGSRTGGNRGGHLRRSNLRHRLGAEDGIAAVRDHPGHHLFGFQARIGRLCDLLERQSRLIQRNGQAGVRQTHQNGPQDQRQTAMGDRRLRFHSDVPVCHGGAIRRLDQRSGSGLTPNSQAGLLAASSAIAENCIFHKV